MNHLQMYLLVLDDSKQALVSRKAMKRVSDY